MMKYLPLLLPLAAVCLAVAIGVSIGLSNLFVREAFDSKTAPVISAGTITVLIMVVAVYLDRTSPDPADLVDE